MIFVLEVQMYSFLAVMILPSLSFFIVQLNAHLKSAETERNQIYSKLGDEKKAKEELAGTVITIFFIDFQMSKKVS